MQLESTERLASLVASALECATSERAQFLHDVCGDDLVLREEAEGLLQFEEKARDFLEVPAFVVTEDVVVEETPPATEDVSEPVSETNGHGETAVLEEAVTSVEEPVAVTEPAPAIIDEEPQIEPQPAASTEEAVTAKSASEPEMQTEPKPEPKFEPRATFVRPAFMEHDAVDIPGFGFYTAARIVVVILLLAAVVVLVGVRRKVDHLRRERDVAQAERARAENVSDFLQRAFSFSNQNLTAVWPVPHRKATTVNEMLDQVAPRIEREFANYPDLRAQMLRMIGSAYASQGEYGAAEKNLRSAFGAQVRLHGEETAATAATMLELGILADRELKPEEAEHLLGKAVDFYRKQRKSNPSQFSPARMALALGYLGDLKFHQGDTSAALSNLSEAVQISSSANLKSEERGVIAFDKGKLGAVFVTLGETEKGEVLLREAIDQYRNASPEARWEIGELELMLGLAALNKDQPDEAQKYLAESEQIFRDTLGDKNLYLVTNMNYQAAALAVKGDFKAAEAKAQESLALSRAVSPDNKLPWTEPLRTLGNILMLAGQTKDGEEYFRQALAICERQPTKNFSFIVPLKIQLCHLLLAQKRITEAENLAFEAQNEARQHFDEENAVRKAATNNLVQIYRKEGKDEIAETVR